MPKLKKLKKEKRKQFIKSSIKSMNIEKIDIVVLQITFQRYKIV